MQIKKGQNRIVFVFLNIGIVVKIPIIHFLEVLRHESLWLPQKRDWKLLKKELTRPVDGGGYFGFRRLLFKGIVDNWREFCFYQKTRHLFLQPVYLSLLGFFNIQQTGKPCFINRRELLNQFKEITQDRISDDSHHFSNPDNFCFDKKRRLRILDYGDPIVQEIIVEYGMKIFDEFDPNYSWEEEKKKKTWQKKNQLKKGYP